MKNPAQYDALREQRRDLTRKLDQAKYGSPEHDALLEQLHPIDAAIHEHEHHDPAPEAPHPSAEAEAAAFREAAAGADAPWPKSEPDPLGAALDQVLGQVADIKQSNDALLVETRAHRANLESLLAEIRDALRALLTAPALAPLDPLDTAPTDPA